MSAHAREDDARAAGAAPEESPIEEAIEEAIDHVLDAVEPVLGLPEPPRSRWQRAGIQPRTERVFDVLAGIVMVLIVTGWSWTVAEAARARATGGEEIGAPTITSALNADAPSTAFLTGAVLEAVAPLRGESGKLRVAMRRPGEPIADSLPAGTRVTVATGAADTATATPRQPGIFRAAVAVGTALRPLADLNIINLVPFTDKRAGRIGTYRIGSWPNERSRRVRKGYELPKGFIEVTPQNQDTPVSQHFTLRDFLTKGQANVWPKYLVLEPRLVDKLELVLSELQASGVRITDVKVLSGFRTPTYNESGGDPRGRATLSRHMYGDAADIFIDNDGNGNMDDLNRDGRLNIGDARVIQQAVDRVERAHPTLVGGAGVYPASSAHGPFIHIDTRGYRARWVGTGDGG